VVGNIPADSHPVCPLRQCPKETAIMDKSHHGLCILTLAPIKVSSVLRIHGNGQGAIIYATVIWCQKGFADIYKYGLSVNENPINPIAVPQSSFVNSQ